MDDDAKEESMKRLFTAVFRKLSGRQSPPPRRDPILEVLQKAFRDNVLDIEAFRILEGAVRLDTMQVRDVMIPRAQVRFIPFDIEWDDLYKIVVDSHYSRFPVFGEGEEKIEGLLLAKDLLPYFKHGTECKIKLLELVRPVLLVPESKRLLVLLREFRQNRTHMAVVMDEFQNIAGILTMEDIIEEIVGEIADEHDDEHEIDYIKQIKRVGHGRYEVPAITPIEIFNTQFSTTLEGEQDTVGGWVSNKFGYLPSRGEKVIADGYEIRVERADRKRIISLLAVECSDASNE